MKFLRFVFFAWVLFVAVYAVKGGEATASVHDASGTISYTFNSSTGALQFTYSMNGDGTVGGATGTHYTFVRAGIVSGNGAAFGTYMVNASTDGNPVNFKSGVVVNQTATAGQWLRLQVIIDRDGTHTGTANQSKWFQLGTENVKKVRIAGTNEGTRPIRLVVRSGASDVIGTIDVAAGASYDQTYTVTDAQDSAGIHLDTYVQDEFKDGVWVQKDTMDTSTATKVDSQSVAAVSLPPGGIPDAPYTAYSNRGPSEAAPTASTSTTSAWTSSNVTTTTVDGERLDKATYREGVDKLERVLTGKPSDVTAAPTTPGTPVFEAPSSPNRLVSKLPSAPSITGPAAPVTSITVALEIPGISVAPVTIDFNRPGFSGPVSVFRSIMLAVMTLIYLVLSIRTVRGAFAGK